MEDNLYNLKKIENNDLNENNFTLNSKISEVINSSFFKDFGRLLFPLNRSIKENMTLKEITSDEIFIWYSNLKPEKSVEIINNLKERVKRKEKIFYKIYTEEEIKKDKTKENTGLFYFKGKKGEKFAIINAGGGFMYVGAMHDSFPQALELSKYGYNAFALIYRTENPYEDLSKAICFIEDNYKELEVDKENYSLWGGSAGARMACILGNKIYLKQLTGKNDINYPAAVIMQYTGYKNVSNYDSPTYANVGENDGIAYWRTMKYRLDELKKLGIDTEFHSYSGLSHGFGLGTGTIAENWINDAIKFWNRQIKNKKK